MSQFKKGAAALGALTTESSGSKTTEITNFKSGTTLKVRVKGLTDIMQYFGYGHFSKGVHTFIPENPPKRNEKGFVTGDPTPWDLASQYYYDQARADKANEQELKNLGYQFKGKERFLMGFFNLETGEDIIVDLTKAQALGVYDTIREYANEEGDDHEFHSMAFKLAKKGSSTSTAVTLTPIVNIAKGLTEEEQKHFAESEGKPFDSLLFDSVLYTANYEEQVRNLVKADFDISLIGLTLGNSAPADEAEPIDDSETTDDPTAGF